MVEGEEQEEEGEEVMEDGEEELGKYRVLEEKRKDDEEISHKKEGVGVDKLERQRKKNIKRKTG